LRPQVLSSACPSASGCRRHPGSWPCWRGRGLAAGRRVYWSVDHFPTTAARRRADRVQSAPTSSSRTATGRRHGRPDGSG
jgi:hypothetical protein